MHLVFAHDHKLRKIGDKYYTTGGLSDEILGKYLNFFDDVTVICRVIKKNSFDSNLSELADSREHIVPYSLNGSLMPSKRSLKKIEEEIKRADGLIVKLHSVIAEFAIFFARKYNVPYLVENIGDPWDAYWNYSKKGKLVAPLMMYLTKREIYRAPYVLYVTKNYLEKRYPTKGKWIDCSDVQLQKIESEVLNKRLENIEKRPYIKKIGTLAQVDVRYKGQEYVIHALKTLKAKGIRIDYELAGSGTNDYLKKISVQDGVEDQVHFIGNLPHDQVFKWLDSIDLYIQPSKQEGLPRSVVEALSRACPALGSQVGGMNELLDANCIFEKGNVEQIVKMLLNVNKNFLIEKAERNFKNSFNYEKEKLTKKRMDFYKEFAKKCEVKKNEL